MGLPGIPGVAVRVLIVVGLEDGMVSEPVPGIGRQESGGARKLMPVGMPFASLRDDTREHDNAILTADRITSSAHESSNGRILPLSLYTATRAWLFVGDDSANPQRRKSEP